MDEGTCRELNYVLLLIRRLAKACGDYIKNTAPAKYHHRIIPKYRACVCFCIPDGSV